MRSLLTLLPLFLYGSYDYHITSQSPRSYEITTPNHEVMLVRTGINRDVYRLNISKSYSYFGNIYIRCSDSSETYFGTAGMKLTLESSDASLVGVAIKRKIASNERDRDFDIYNKDDELVAKVHEGWFSTAVTLPDNPEEVIATITTNSWIDCDYTVSIEDIDLFDSMGIDPLLIPLIKIWDHDWLVSDIYVGHH